MFEHLIREPASAEEAGLAELRAQLWAEPVLDDHLALDDLDAFDPAVADEAVWAERERVAHALWEQEYCTTDGALARVARYEADAARAVGSKLRAIVDFVHQRMRTVAAAIAVEARDGGTREELEASIHAAEESAEAELGLWMHLSPAAASNWIDFATGLARRLPRTLDALEAGRIGERMARILLKETGALSIGQTAWVERQVLPLAYGRTPASFGRLVRRRVEQVDADAVLKRHAAARTERRVSFTPAGDGMAWLSAYLPAEEAAAVFGVIDTFAHARVPGDQRSLDQRRADALVDVVARPGQQDPRVGYVIHMHASSTSSSEDAAGGTVEVPGGGAIPTQRARETADLTVHHPAVPVDIAAILADYNSRPDVYRPSAKLKRAIRLRDRHCRFPGCRRPADRCEIDHTIAFEIGGRTVYINLAALCKHHHRVKHLPGWTCTQDEAGVLTWTTPTGRTYITRPPPPVGDEPPDFQAAAPLRPHVDDAPPF